jgi:hypothetical protein
MLAANMVESGLATDILATGIGNSPLVVVLISFGVPLLARIKTLEEVMKATKVAMETLAREFERRLDEHNERIAALEDRQDRITPSPRRRPRTGSHTPPGRGR